MSSQDQTTAAQGTGRDEKLVPKTILQTMEGLPALSQFLQGVRAAEMEGELLMPAWRTLFAPTNEALEAAPNDLWNELMTPENSNRLKAIVALHIVHGRQMFIDLKTAATVKSLAGQPMKVSISGAEGYFAGARILRPDIVCSNGQVHLIDKLIVQEYAYAG